MNSLSLQCDDQCKGAGGSWVDMNILCIVDQDRQRWVITEGHTSKFKVL